MRKIFFLLLIFLSVRSSAQNSTAARWADSVFKSLSPEERIAQLMVVRLSTYDARTKTVTFYDSLVTELIKKYNIGGICLFQGSPVKQANLLNALQAQAAVEFQDATGVVVVFHDVGHRVGDFRRFAHALEHRIAVGEADFLGGDRVGEGEAGEERWHRESGKRPRTTGAGSFQTGAE